jgi:hypothetical protein
VEQRRATALARTPSRGTDQGTRREIQVRNAPYRTLPGGKWSIVTRQKPANICSLGSLSKMNAGHAERAQRSECDGRTDLPGELEGASIAVEYQRTQGRVAIESSSKPFKHRTRWDAVQGLRLQSSSRKGAGRKPDPGGTVRLRLETPLREKVPRFRGCVADADSAAIPMLAAPPTLARTERRSEHRARLPPSGPRTFLLPLPLRSPLHRWRWQR